MFGEDFSSKLETDLACFRSSQSLRKMLESNIRTQLTSGQRLRGKRPLDVPRVAFACQRPKPSEVDLVDGILDVTDFKG
jgi:hypothetical protein